MSWQLCHHCLHWFDYEKFKEYSGIIMFKEKIEGYICPFCKGEVPAMGESIQEEAA